MATYILLDPNEIVQQQQAMAAAAAAAMNNTTNIPNKNSSFNDVSLNEQYFLFFLLSFFLSIY